MFDTILERNSIIKHVTIKSPKIKEIKQIHIVSNTPDWNQYLKLSVDYLLENWPDVVEKGKTKASFTCLYEQQLVQRIKEGGRILLLWKIKDEPIGFANVWIEEGEGSKAEEQGKLEKVKEREKTLQIAEFSILKPYRRKGLGQLFLQDIFKIGLQNKVTKVIAEVDECIDANRFWLKVMSNCIKNESKGRNLYWSWCPVD